MSIFFKALFVLFLTMPSVFGALNLDYSLGYSSDDYGEDRNPFNLKSHRNELSIGVSFGPNGRIMLGHNVLMWSRDASREVSSVIREEELSFMEMGPKLTLFLNQGKNFYLSGAYHFYVDGTRKITGSAEEEMKGSAWLASFGMQMGLTRSFYLGFSLNYHTLSIDETSLNSVVNEVDLSYTSFYPALEVSFRFGGTPSRSRARNSFPRSWRP